MPMRLAFFSPRFFDRTQPPEVSCRPDQELPESESPITEQVFAAATDRPAAAQNEMEQKIAPVTNDEIHAIIGTALKLPPSLITDATAPENTPSWDSLQSIHLVLALEDTLGLSFSAREVGEMRNVAAIKRIVHKKARLG